MVTSDGISQCQTNPIGISTEDAPQDFITGILLLDIIKSIAQFDTFSTAFVGYSKCKIGVMEQFEEGLLDTRCIVRISNLKALRDCVLDEQAAIYLTKIHLIANDSKATYITTLVNGTYSDKIT